MKTIISLIALSLFAWQIALADNVTPDTTQRVNLWYSGANKLDIWVLKTKAEVAEVNIYDLRRELVHTEQMRHTDEKRFDLSNLKPGKYTVEVSLGRRVVFAETIDKPE